MKIGARVIKRARPAWQRCFVMRCGIRCCFLLLLTLSLSTGALAQSVYGTLRVALTVKGGQPVSRALVEVISTEQGDLVKFSAQTDEAGRSTFDNLPLGAYKVTMQKDGCRTYEEPYVSVSAGETSEIDRKSTRLN